MQRVAFGLQILSFCLLGEVRTCLQTFSAGFQDDQGAHRDPSYPEVRAAFMNRFMSVRNLDGICMFLAAVAKTTS